MSEMKETLPLYSANSIGFKRYIKLSMDDIPLIRPPRHHMLAHITGGLQNLYKLVLERKDKADGSQTVQDGENIFTSCSDNFPLNRNNAKSGHKISTNVNGQKDDEGGGCLRNDVAFLKKDSVFTDGSDEATPFTDEEGEFCPEPHMPCLAARYKFIKVLARGQSALIIKAQDTFCKNRSVAIKVLHKAYKPIGLQEADILLELHRADPWLHVSFARLQNQFIYGPHYCLVFDFFTPIPLYTHYDQKDIRGPRSLPFIKNLTVKLLTVMGFLYKQNVIHADLKPENILLKDEKDLSSAVVIDFGNALRNTDEELSLYYSDFELQTLIYRAPEVIFGMKFGLEIDMWSIGCLLAECYLGEPLFMGKTKMEILSKITKLLGPLPKEFNEGECSKEFSGFLGKPLSPHQRIQNLRKKLKECRDINFLLLVENLLTFHPEGRITPFEAACHSFVAENNPFLYLTPSSGLIHYPTVVLDTLTYPYSPEIKVDGNSSTTLHSQNRLLALSGSKKSLLAKQEFAKQQETSPVNSSTKHQSIGSDEESRKVSEELKGNRSLTIETRTVGKDKSVDEETKKESIKKMKETDSSVVSRSDVKETLKSMGLRCEDFTISVYSREQAHAILRKQGIEMSGSPQASRSSLGPPRARNPSNPNIPMPHIRRQVNQRGAIPMPPQAWAGLGISPMSMHAMGIPAVALPHMRMPGLPYIRPRRAGRPPKMPYIAKGDTSMMMPNLRTSPKSMDGEELKKGGDEDDDDCVILDHVPPMSKGPPQKLPQQFQLMGTTVQVNRGVKRPIQSSTQGATSKSPGLGTPNRLSPNLSMPLAADVSVQDTLKRLKGYNISITCRKNTKGLAHKEHPDSESDGSNYNSEEEDFTRYLECQIGEEGIVDDASQGRCEEHLKSMSTEKDENLRAKEPKSPILACLPPSKNLSPNPTPKNSERLENSPKEKQLKDQELGNSSQEKDQKEESSDPMDPVAADDDDDDDDMEEYEGEIDDDMERALLEESTEGNV